MYCRAVNKKLTFINDKHDFIQNGGIQLFLIGIIVQS
jgi:hypothetical protein